MSATERLSSALAGRYRIERALGQGGMATVYLAEDLKHHRNVAIKVLKPELAAVLGAERFVQEIQTTAQLQHPHILPLFDSGSADGFLYYVMPYIEGETLRERLDRDKQLGIDDAVRITREVADALDYAHRQGVVHRDIKPENILLHDGRPMVADFGIALAVSAAAGGRMTETGLSLGTPHYMSPEQATADRDISARSDVYSLASVCYEMLAGEPPHLGGTAQQIIMKIIAEPVGSVTKHRKNVPANVAAALAQALEKLPADRFDSAKAFGDALADPGFHTRTSVPGHPLARPSGHPSGWVTTAAAVITVAALAFGVMEWRAAHHPEPPVAVRFQVDLHSSILPLNTTANGTNVAVSPDGLTLAFAATGDAGTPQIWLRRLNERAAKPIAGTDGAQQPCFSPDGQWIAYLVGTTVWKVQLNGSPPVLLGNLQLSPIGLTWSTGGYIVAGTAAGLVGIQPGGGAARVLAPTDSAAGDQYFNQPKALADGKTVLFAIQGTAGLSQTHLAVATLPEGTVRRFDLVVFDPIVVIDGTLVYVQQSGALTAVPIDLRGGRATGSPLNLGVTATTTVAGSSELAISATGTVVYQSPSADGTVGWVDTTGDFEPVLTDPQAYSYPRLSPDGRTIALTIAAGNQSNIWLYDIASATPMQLTEAGAQNERVEWTPDGQRVLFRTDRGGPTAIWWQPADKSAPATPLQGGNDQIYEGVLTPDGRTLVYQVDDGGTTQADIMYRSLEGDTTSKPVAATSAIEAQPRVSPDGRWVAYVTDASGGSQVMVRPFPGPGGQVQVSAAEGSEPIWSHDGKRLFYRDGRHLIAASVTSNPGFAVTGRKALFEDRYQFATAPHANYDVSPDGSRFLMVKAASQPELVVVYGWLNELRRQMKAAGS